MPANPDIVVDNRTGQILVGDKDDPSAGYTPMDTKVMDKTFVKNIYQDNSSPVDRKGLEVTVDFPQIPSIRTQFRFDAAYTNVKYVNEGFSYIYKGKSVAFVDSGRSFEYVGIYADNGGSTTATWQPADEASRCEPDRHYAHSVDPDGHLVAPGGVAGFRARGTSRPITVNNWPTRWSRRAELYGAEAALLYGSGRETSTITTMPPQTIPCSRG